MMSSYNEQSGIIFPGTLTQTILAEKLWEDTDVEFISTLHESEVINNQSNITLGSASSSCLPDTTHGSVKTTKGTLSQHAWTALHPLFTQITD